MPNWCNNELHIITKTEEERQDILNTIRNDEEAIDFTRIVVPPDTPAYRNEYEGSQSKISNDPTFWYNWNVENWGTKWNPHGTLQGDGIVFFDTAWSPPIPVIRALGKLFPNAAFLLHYRELGMDFEGEFVMLNGEEERDDCRDARPDLCWLTDVLYSQLEEE